MRKQFYIPRDDIKIHKRSELSEEEDFPNSFSNHPTDGSKPK